MVLIVNLLINVFKPRTSSPIYSLAIKYLEHTMINFRSDRPDSIIFYILVFIRGIKDIFIQTELRLKFREAKS